MNKSGSCGEFASVRIAAIVAAELLTPCGNGERDSICRASRCPYHVTDDKHGDRRPGRQRRQEREFLGHPVPVEQLSSAKQVTQRRSPRVTARVVGCCLRLQGWQHNIMIVAYVIVCGLPRHGIRQVALLSGEHNGGLIVGRRGAVGLPRHSHSVAVGSSNSNVDLCDADNVGTREV